jgi:hypothetical protein
VNSLLLDAPLAGLAAGFFVALWLAYEAGYAGGGRVRQRKQDSVADFGTIQGAVLGLLGLLLAFTYSLASARHDTRKQLVVREANAIGTAWLRADFLPEPARGELRSALRRYLDERILPENLTMNAEGIRSYLGRQAAWQRELWGITRRGVTDGAPQHDELLQLLVEAINEVLDVHSMRVAAAADHVPPVVLVLLLVCAVFAMALTGFGCGFSRRRNHTLTLTLALMIVCVTAVTLDLDRPRRGFIRVSQQPLMDLRQDLAAEAAK